MSEQLYKDLGLQQLDKLMELVKAENRCQLAQWGIQSMSGFAWLAIATEEFGETAQAIVNHEHGKGDCTQIIAESVQAISLLLKIAEIYMAKRQLEIDQADPNQICQECTAERDGVWPPQPTVTMGRCYYCKEHKQLVPLEAIWPKEKQ